jgi:hypothetical protein
MIEQAESQFFARNTQNMESEKPGTIAFSFLGLL